MHARHCDQHQCLVVLGKKQETNTGGKATMPDHYRCTITCAFCGKRKHYKDDRYHKQRLSAKLKSEAQNGGRSSGGKSNGGKGRGKSQEWGKGKGQEQSKGGGSGGPDRKNQDKNQDRSGRDPNPTPGGTNPEFSGGQLTGGPQPVPGRKRKNNKELSVAGKMGTSLTLVNVPASCRWRENCARRGFNVTCPAGL